MNNMVKDVKTISNLQLGEVLTVTEHLLIVWTGLVYQSL